MLLHYFLMSKHYKCSKAAKKGRWAPPALIPAIHLLELRSAREREFKGLPNHRNIWPTFYTGFTDFPETWC